MPTIQKSMRSPSSSRGTPKRSSWSASVRARAISSVASASSVIASVMSASGALSSTSSTHEALERQLARDAQRGDERRAFAPAAARRAATIVARSGSAGRQGARARRHSDDARAARSGCTSRAACHESLPQRAAVTRGEPAVWEPIVSPGVCARLNRPARARRCSVGRCSPCRTTKRSSSQRTAVRRNAVFMSSIPPPGAAGLPPAAPDRRGGRPCDRPCAPCCGCCWRCGSCCSWVGSHFTG